MKRSARQISRPEVIISCSDSENEPVYISSDDNYVPEKAVSKIVRKKRKISITNDNNQKLLKKDNQYKIAMQSENEKVQIEFPNAAVESTGLKKKIQNKDMKIKYEKIQDLDKKNIKQILEDIPFNSVECKEWDVVDYISETNNVERHITENVVKLFSNDNTIPFIARYRRDMTGGMEPDKLRALKESLNHANLIKQRAEIILKAIDRLGHWSPNIYSVIVSVKCLDDLEHIYSLFKPASKRTLAERAKELGLGTISDLVLQGHTLPALSSIIDRKKDGLKSEQQIIDGIIHIIADTINKNKIVFDKVKELQSESVIKIETTKYKTNSKRTDNKEKDIHRKYETYYDFNTNTKYIKPHQILAINRGEIQKILTIKITLPDSFERDFKKHCYKQYKVAMNVSKIHSKLLNESIDYAYTKFIKPLVVRRVRSEMKQKAEIASIEVFVTNVKQLLLTPPVRGKIILGIDPGFLHGCKLAVISEQGDILETGVIYPHKNVEGSYDKSVNVLINLVTKHKATILALGNATACRETEAFINKLIKSNAFGLIDVSYTIVDESGASIYSCSSEAKSEFPNLDTNLISAVSIARRLQDPLAELVKIEPKHLGVGMYQHDLPVKQLLTALNEVVSEVVSFVGVDVNTASRCLLKRVAGLNTSKANNIIEWRSKFGPFKNRHQLMDVKGIGSKIFEQCAGFIRILPETSITDNSEKCKSINKSKQTCNLLDQTWIHPESYKIAERFLKYCNCNIENLGITEFIEKVKLCAEEGISTLAKKFDTNEATMEVIIKGLSMKKNEDVRLKYNSPLFRRSMFNINDINVGMSLTGAIRNSTHFGAFVDVGAGKDGLIPTRWLKNGTVSIGQRVEVKVLSVDPKRGRITLELVNAL
ncbi:S1 RNA-binding domain-containing protein 1 [Eufriesea mexicana]|uniref:S1 RNA-binding domain-containing protein 1 n=1 Tax=Eufriesea mexicana TaxID=516756 RepID=A0A310SAC6_9HYME|nr:PREDICTED: S1 RNA-binding domain-containing protein 1 [Eufriesea mexicana]OAD53888.1 S1 RNA-binding domain-containing protein 1 [Eufriesea mexicana]